MVNIPLLVKRLYSCLILTFLRVVHPYCASAMVLLMNAIIHRPTHEASLADMNFIRPHLQNLDSLAAKSKAKDVEWMRDICSQMAVKAEAALAIAELQVDIAPTQPNETLEAASFPPVLQTNIFDDPMLEAWATGTSSFGLQELTPPSTNGSALDNGDHPNKHDEYGGRINELSPDAPLDSMGLFSGYGHTFDVSQMVME
jgi:hypothetical protein